MKSWCFEDEFFKLYFLMKWLLLVVKRIVKVICRSEFELMLKGTVSQIVNIKK